MLEIDDQGAGDFSLGRMAGLEITAGRSSIVASALFWVVATVLARWRLRAALPAAAAWGGAILLLHQLGHASAAKKVGYPMTGLRLWALFSAGQYPADEPELPATIHVQRALGGPAVSTATGLLLAPLALFASRGSAVRTLSRFALIDNLVVLGLGAFLPLGFTDGGTLLRWGPKLREEGQAPALPVEYR